MHYTQLLSMYFLEQKGQQSQRKKSEHWSRQKYKLHSNAEMYACMNKYITMN